MTDLFREMSAGESDGNETIRGSGSPDSETLRGGAGNDLLISDGGYETTLEGGKGNDTLRGGSTHDSYVFNLGDGRDLVQHYNAEIGSYHQGEIRFGAGIAQSDIVASQSGMDLLLQHVNGQDAVRVQDWFDPQKGSLAQVNQVAFADGGSWSAAQLGQMSSQAQALVGAMAAFNPPAAGQMSLSADHASEAPTLAASGWK